MVGNPPPHFGGRYFIFLKLTSDSGVEGVGEVYAATFGPHVVARMIEDVCQRHVIGGDPFKIEALWRKVYGSGYTLRPDVSLVGVLSGIEMACWDIVGKELGKPVYELLGGQVHEKLRSYTYLYPKEGDKTDVYADPDAAAERAAERPPPRASPRSSSTRPAPTASMTGDSRRWKRLSVRNSSSSGCAKRSAPRLTCCSAPMVSSRPRALSAWPADWSPTTRCGSRSRRRRRTRPRWRGSPARPRSPSPRASG